MKNWETPTIVGAPKKLEILPNWEDLVWRNSLGIEKQSPLNERKGNWGWWERVIQVFVVLFGEFEIFHIWIKERDGPSNPIYSFWIRKLLFLFLFFFRQKIIFKIPMNFSCRRSKLKGDNSLLVFKEVDVCSDLICLWMIEIGFECLIFLGPARV